MSAPAPFTPLGSRPPFRPGLRSCSCLATLPLLLALCVCGVLYLVEHL